MADRPSRFVLLATLAVGVACFLLLAASFRAAPPATPTETVCSPPHTEEAQAAFAQQAANASNSNDAHREWLARRDGDVAQYIEGLHEGHTFPQLRANLTGLSGPVHADSVASMLAEYARYHASVRDACPQVCVVAAVGAGLCGVSSGLWIVGNGGLWVVSASRVHVCVVCGHVPRRAQSCWCAPCRTGFVVG